MYPFSQGQLAAFIDAVGKRLSKGEETKDILHNLLRFEATKHIAIMLSQCECFHTEHARVPGENG